MEEYKLKVDFPKEAGDSKYMEELQNIENETGISLKIVMQMKGSHDQLEKAKKRISQIKYLDKVNIMTNVDIVEEKIPMPEVTKELFQDNLVKEVQCVKNTYLKKIDQVEKPQTDQINQDLKCDLQNLGDKIFFTEKKFPADQPIILPTEVTRVKFVPPTGTDEWEVGSANFGSTYDTRYQCITMMEEYESKSMEELRFEDYAANRKGSVLN